MKDTSHTAERDALREQLSGAIRTGEITLASGRTTDFYFDGRLVTLDPRGLSLVAKLCFERVADRCDAVGGPTSGADPMVVGVGLESLAAGAPLGTFFTRKESKGHGMGKRIEGPPLADGARVFVLDDVATSGGSILRAVEAIREDTGATVVGALVIVDRQEGATEALAAVDVPLEALFTKADFR